MEHILQEVLTEEIVWYDKYRWFKGIISLFVIAMLFGLLLLLIILFQHTMDVAGHIFLVVFFIPCLIGTGALIQETYLSTKRRLCISHRGLTWYNTDYHQYAPWHTVSSILFWHGEIKILLKEAPTLHIPLEQAIHEQKPTVVGSTTKDVSHQVMARGFATITFTPAHLTHQNWDEGLLQQLLHEHGFLKNKRMNEYRLETDIVQEKQLSDLIQQYWQFFLEHPDIHARLLTDLPRDDFKTLIRKVAFDPSKQHILQELFSSSSSSH